MRNRPFLIFVCLLTLGFFAGCATVPKKSLPSANEAFLKDLCDLHQIHIEWDNVSRVVTLSFQDQRAKFLVGSDVVFINNDKIYLSSATRIEQSAIIVPIDFKTKIIDRLTPVIYKHHAVTYAAHPLREVIIDPGHGGKDPGAIGRVGTREKDIVLDVSRRIKRLLEKDGIKVRMTRNRDEFITLQGRTEMACRSKADLFVSIHANSSPVKAVSGMEIYSLRDLDYSERNEAQRKANTDLMFRHLLMDRKDHDLQNIVSDLLYSYKQAEGSYLAGYISEQVPEISRIKSRGSKVARFYVLRNTMIPAVLVEIGYVTNPQEERQLRQSVYRQKIAGALAETISSYVRSR